jgi:6-phosphogluconolactonase
MTCWMLMAGNGTSGAITAMVDIQRFADSAQLTAAAAQHFTQLARQAMQARGRFSVALAGGSTPRALYELLATNTYAAQIEWAQVYVFWGDERCVPSDHQDSNYRMAHEALLTRVPIPIGNINRMRGELEPAAAAVEYEQALTRFFGGEEGQSRFDLALLGLGDDAHTASLFPHTAALAEAVRPVVANYVEKLDAWRITLTAPVINRAAHVAFLVTGEGKARALHSVLQGPRQPETLPAQLIAPADGLLTWFVDEAAARLLA